MKHTKLRRMIFLALCCDLGLFTKRLVAFGDPNDKRDVKQVVKEDFQ